MPYRLSPKLSFRVYTDFTILLDHSSGKLMKLNRSAGRIIERLNDGEYSFTAEENDFIHLLQQHGIVFYSRISARDASDADSQQASGLQESAVLKELNAYARKNLIPLNCQIEITHRCDSRCRHCYLASETPRPDEELKTGEIKRFIDELAEMGGLFLSFTGGEPFSRPDLEELFLHARKRHFAVSILTSGWRVEGETLKRLAGYGMDGAQVSIHGPDEESHDAFTRRPGSFKAALQALTTLKKQGVPVRAAVNVHKDNFHLLDDILSLLAEHGIRRNFNLNMLPRLDGDRSPRDLQLDEKQIRRVAMIKPLRSRFRLKDLAPDDPVCGAGRSVLAVDPYGAVYPCISWRHPAGSVKTQSLTDIWNNSKDLADIRGLRFGELEDCPSCEYRDTCNRCTGLAVTEGLEPKNHSFLDCVQARVYSGGWDVF